MSGTTYTENHMKLLRTVRIIAYLSFSFAMITLGVFGLFEIHASL